MPANCSSGFPVPGVAERWKWSRSLQWWCSHRESQKEGDALCQGSSSAYVTLKGWTGAFLRAQTHQVWRLPILQTAKEWSSIVKPQRWALCCVLVDKSVLWVARNAWELFSANRDLNSGLRNPASGVLIPWAAPAFKFSTHRGCWSSRLWFPCIRSHREQQRTSFSISSSVSFCISIKFIDSFLKTFKLTTV